ncbi:4'-phosphopantetheinyl transferase superfamily protein [uncultured Lacinutrix sp.]|uniref:4'-phosphopantetheinyl transferase superfamily protein n=1 Tax=uncultured Lacinutrix sp. TaxID=574032 RepID=UPI002617BC67|nr:4'-phosphopantetheinyl transferase superfamily protein [uncultured Lacinutrix sp.]
MIGNDIVDLNYAAKHSPYSNSKRYQRFLDKVFTKKEQLLIFNAEDKHQMVWLLWSMKEAAYKVNVQQFGKQFYNPKRIDCKLLNDKKGQVIIDENLYFTESIITDDFSHSIATLEGETDFKSEWFKVEKLDYKTQSKMLKYSFLKLISETKGFNIQTLSIKKTEVGIPKLFNESKKLCIDFSLSHCGEFSGFVF